MSDRIDVGELRVPGGYFLLKEERRSRLPFTADPGVSQDGYTHCFTYIDSESTIKQVLLEMVRQAKRKIFITSFRVGDPELLQVLYEAADRLRGGIYLITALDERSLARGLAELDDDAGDDLKAQNKRFGELTNRGFMCEVTVPVTPSSSLWMILSRWCPAPTSRRTRFTVPARTVSW